MHSRTAVSLLFSAFLCCSWVGSCTADEPGGGEGEGECEGEGEGETDACVLERTNAGCPECDDGVVTCVYELERSTANSCGGCQAREALVSQLCASGNTDAAQDIEAGMQCFAAGALGAPCVSDSECESGQCTIDFDDEEAICVPNECPCTGELVCHDFGPCGSTCAAPLEAGVQCLRPGEADECMEVAACAEGLVCNEERVCAPE